MNCKNLIISAFKDCKSDRLQRYLDCSLAHFNALNSNTDHDCKIVPWE